MNHQQAHEKLIAYLDARLSDIERAALERHLAGCADCQRELADLQAAHTWLGQSINAVASHASAPSDAWARFESRKASETHFGQQSFRKRTSMEPTNRRNQPPKGLLLGFAAAAAAIVLVGIGIVAMILLNQNQQGQISENPSITPSATGQSTGGEPTVTNTAPTPTIDINAYMTQRPQSGGGSGQPDGGNGSSLFPYRGGTITAYDPAAGTITLDSGQVARLLPSTTIYVTDVTFDGYRGTPADIQVGDYIGMELLDEQPDPPFIYILWLNHPTNETFLDLNFERNSGTISSIDNATGIFTVDIWNNRSFKFDPTTPVYRNDDTPDGEPIAFSDLKVGDMLSFVNLTDQGEPSPVVQIVVERTEIPPFTSMYRADITAINGSVLEINVVQDPNRTLINLSSVDLGDRATAAGVSFAVGDVVFVRIHARQYAYMLEPEHYVIMGVFKLQTGEYVALRDEAGNPIP